MIIKRLIMNNFRQFRDKHSLHFAGSDEKNVTIIMGPDGSGKTTIMRAILFALFDDIRLPQDSNNLDMNIVNEAAMKATIGKEVLAEVELVFEHEGIKYRISRKITGYFDGQGFFQAKDSDCCLDILRSNWTEKTITDQQLIATKIANMITKDISNLFFFSSQGWQLATQSNTPMPANSGIYHLLKIDDLIKARTLAQDLKNKIQYKLSTDTRTSKLQTLNSQLSDTEVQIKDNQQSITRIKSEKVQIEQEIKFKTERYQDLEQTKQVVEELNSLKDRHAQVVQELDHYTGILNKTITEGSKQLFADLLNDTKDKVKILKLNSEIPDSVYQKSQADQQCFLCGNDLSTDPKAFNYMNELWQAAQSCDYLEQIEAGIDEVETKQTTFWSEQEKILQDYHNEKQQEQELQAQIVQLNQHLIGKDTDLSGLETLKQNITQLKNNLKDQESQLQQLQSKILELNSTQDKLKQTIQEYKLQNHELMQQKQQVNLLEEIIKRLDQIMADESNDLRKQLQTEMLNCFHQLCNDQDIQQIEISSYYQFHFYNTRKQDISNNLSRQQQQMLAVAFVLTMVKTIYQEPKTLLFPLFLDSPLIQINSQNREYLFNQVAQTSQQWVMLMGPEFTVADREYLAHQENIGRIYQLNVRQNYGATSVEEIQNLSSGY